MDYLYSFLYYFEKGFLSIVMQTSLCGLRLLQSNYYDFQINVESDQNNFRQSLFLTIHKCVKENSLEAHEIV